MQEFYSISENYQSLKLRAKKQELPLEAENPWCDREHLSCFEQPFVVDHGKRVKDILAYHECNLPFFSEKAKNIIAQFVPNADNYLFPVHIEGVDATYFVMHDLPTYGEILNSWESLSSEKTCIGLLEKTPSLFSVNNTRLILCSEELKNALKKAKVSNIYFRTYYAVASYDEYCLNKEFLRAEQKAYDLQHNLYYHLFRPAEMKDLDAICNIIHENVAYMHNKGQKQWDNSYPARKHILADIESGEGYVLEVNDECIAYAAVSSKEEPAYKRIKGKWQTDGKYLVVHRMTVKVSYHNRGYAQWLFSEIEHLAKEQKISSVRVDTSSDNVEMLAVLKRKLYPEANTFVYCGTVRYFRNMHFQTRMAFEKIITLE